MFECSRFEVFGLESQLVRCSRFEVLNSLRTLCLCGKGFRRSTCSNIELRTSNFERVLEGAVGDLVFRSACDDVSIHAADQFQRIISSIGYSRDHLRQQPEDEHLDPDDNQESTQNQQRPVADVGYPCQPEHREIKIYGKADRTKGHADESEEVQRPPLEAPQEQDGKQIKRAAEKTLEAIFRFSVTARAMIDSNLANAKTVGVRQDRDITMQFAVEVQRFDNFPAIRLEAAIEILQSYARQRRSNGIK